MQSEHETEPFPLVYAPGLHEEHCKLFDSFAIVFFGQAEHDSVPLRGATFPGWQGKQ
jgi:hypothetical protein